MAIPAVPPSSELHRQAVAWLNAAAEGTGSRWRPSWRSPLGRRPVVVPAAPPRVRAYIIDMVRETAYAQGDPEWEWTPENEAKLALLRRGIAA